MKPQEKISEEYELLSQASQPYAGLFPGYESGANVLKNLVGRFVGDFSAITDGMISGLISAGFFKTLEEKAEVKQGDVQHIVGKFAKLKEITLTNKKILLLYQKGWFSKKNKLIVIPLKYATDVSIAEGKKRIVVTEKRRIGLELDSVYISFHMTEKEQDVTKCFNLALSVDKPWIWTKAIERLLGLDSRQEKEKTCRVVNTAPNVFNYHVLCITQKRLVSTKFFKRSYFAITIPTLIAAVGLLFIPLMAIFVTAIGGIRGWTVPMLFTDSLFLALFVPGATLFLIGYFGANFLRKRRYKHLTESEPQTLLDTESKSFEIPYSEITQVKIKKKRLGRAQKVEITTQNETKTIRFAKRTELSSFRQVIQRFLPERKITLE